MTFGKRRIGEALEKNSKAKSRHDITTCNCIDTLNGSIDNNSISPSVLATTGEKNLATITSFSITAHSFPTTYLLFRYIFRLR